MALAQIEVRNTFCLLPDTCPVGLLRALDREMAYFVEGAEQAPAFKSGFWDGREHLLSKVRNKPFYHFPAGLLPMLLKSELGDAFEYIDTRRPVGERRVFSWHGKPPRDFQVRSLHEATKQRGPPGLEDLITGRGLLNLPIRSGKTTVAALVIMHFGLRTVFIVPSGMLLYQTRDSLMENLGRDAPIGIIGDSEWQPDFITVATIQTIIAQIDRFNRELRPFVDLMLQDEAHHLEGPAWRQPVLNMDARYKIGLSATIFSNKDVPAERASIWLQAATGPILYRVSMQYLFNHGFLLRPHIAFYTIPAPKGKRSLWYKDAYEQLIERNEHRNSAIADLAEEAALDRGLSVLVDSGRYAQTKRIRDMLRARGVKAEEITGKTPMEKRLALIHRFRGKEIQCLVGTVLGEGIDIPELEVVINAEGLRSKKAVIQRMRNLTPPPIGASAKSEVLFIDFNDVTHDKLEEHSTERLSMYEGTRGFLVSKGLAIGNDGRYHLPPR